MTNLELRGVLPALLTPFDDQLDIDTLELSRLTRRVLDAEANCGVFVNGHAGEVAALDRDEQRVIVDVVAQETSGRVPVVSGIYTDNLREAVRLGRNSASAGATALTVFPPPSFGDGGCESPRMPLLWHRSIWEEVGLPLIVFQFDRGSGLDYDLSTLEQLFALPYVAAVKEGSNSPTFYPRVLELAAQAEHHVSVLTSNNSWLLASLSMGGDGILSGSASVLPDSLGRLWRAIEREDLATARNIQHELDPLLRQFYRAPFIDMHVRMKSVLHSGGLLERPYARPPLIETSESELAELQKTVKVIAELSQQIDSTQ